MDYTKHGVCNIVVRTYNAGKHSYRNWTKELERNQPSLIRAMLKTFGIHYMFVGLLCFINSCLTRSVPIPFILSVCSFWISCIL